MNRAARRRMGVRGTGVKVRTQQRPLPPDPAPGGPHQWVVTAAWKLTDATARLAATGGPMQDVYLDTENLLTISGPGCWVCEQVWSEDLASSPCPGAPGPERTQTD